MHKESYLGEITTEWDDTYLFSREAALEELEALKQRSKELCESYRRAFGAFSGFFLLGYLEAEKAFLKSLDFLGVYASTRQSKNVTEKFFSSLAKAVLGLKSEHEKSISFVTVRLSSLSEDGWTALFTEEPGLEKYRPFFEARYLRFAGHLPLDEAHAAYLVELDRERVLLQNRAFKNIMSNSPAAGSITLEDGREFAVDSLACHTLLSTDPSRANRKNCFEARHYQLLKESDLMAALFLEKAELDARYAGELNYADIFEARLHTLYLSAGQLEDMYSVFKSRKGVFEAHYEFRKEKLGLESLAPYDLYLQLGQGPDKRYGYAETVTEVRQSYAGMAPIFHELLCRSVTGNFIDVYPDPEGGKQPGTYCAPLYALQSPSLIFLNYGGLIDDRKSLTHELGHSIHFYLMGNSVDYFYCGGTEYELEVPSTFNEELLVDRVVTNSDRESAVAILSQHIDLYRKYFNTVPLVSEFEQRAHLLCAGKDGCAGKDECAGKGGCSGKSSVSGAELNSLWGEISKEYVSESIEGYDKASAEWASVFHIYLASNFYIFNYAVSAAISLALFRQYKENPEEFNRNYIEYLSAGTTVPPAEKLKKYFGIEINRQLFEDAMDTVELRIRQLEELAA